MDYFEKGAGRPVKLTVKRDRIRDIKRGYPWIFAHSLISPPQAPSGAFALLRDEEGNFVAKGMYDIECPIVFRVCALEEELNGALIVSKLERAVALRRSVLDAETSACRLINGEGDGLPGLVCDAFGDTGILQLDGAGPAAFWKIEEIAAWLRENTNLRNLYLKPRSDSKETGRVLLGKAPKNAARFLEQGVKFEANLIEGQKSGFFLDQRENRERIRKISGGKKVLNLFGYTGGFSVYAGLGGAHRVVTVDIAKPAIEAATRNWEINNLPSSAHEAIAVNAFDYLQSSGSRETFDIVIADPPSFVSSKAALEKGRAAYVSLFAQCAAVTASNGIFAASSCSSHIPPEMFLEMCEEAVSKARRRATVLSIHGQPSDHPFPLACPELRYLKFVLLRL